MKRISYIIILQLLLTFNYCNSQWYQINLPVAGSVYKMQFTNTSTGWATVKQTNNHYTLIKTTNSGLNWFSIYSDSAKVITFQFINDTLGYAMGKYEGFYLMSKTLNGGNNWTTMQSSYSDVYSGFYMVNADTGWVNAFALPTQITLRTTNGFQTLEQISSGAGGSSATLFFFKEKYNGEYCGYLLGAGLFWKTTNSGFTWQQISTGSSDNVNSFSFVNKDTGWVVIGAFTNNNKILKTNNGCLSWSTQFLATLGNALNIFALTKNRIWCGATSNLVFTSTNSGITWGTQASAIHANAWIYMVDSLLGFTWSGNDFYMARTTNGGGAITGLNQSSTEVPEEYSLGQNYPNPFNPTTNIPFELKEPSHVTLKVFDARGREVKELVNGRWGKGKFIADFDASQFATGIYFYQIIVSGETTHQTFAETRKMMVLK
ncbi:MAG: T9SS type A sorting domain-containing protein [Ignavibacteriae bacterium]|nr:T9SS type A sorting domain-containing protein [Ignavibacteriota bacterium]